MLAFPAAAQLSSPDCGNDDDDESNTVCDGGRSVSGTRIAQRGDCIKGGGGQRLVVWCLVCYY